jgi:hypothetical protein
VTKIAGTAGVAGAATTFGTVIESLTSTATAVTDWKATANIFATAIITFGAAGLTCDTAKWDSATACHGVDMPWGYGEFKEYTSTGPVNGSIRAWHFLAEKNADTSKNFQIVKDDKINWIVQETIETATGTTPSMTRVSTSAHAFG